MRIRGLIPGAIGAAVIATVSLVAVAPSSSGAAPTPGDGISCEPGNGTYALSTATGRISMPDGNTIFSWGYSASRGSFQLPGPVLCVNVGQHVTITLTNNLPNDDTSLIFPGQDSVLADGVPSLPVSVGGRVVSLAPMAARKPANQATGGAVTYEFTPTRPGTFLYESGTDVDKQVQMGLYGAIIVRPVGYDATAPKAYDDPRSAYEPEREFLHILSEVDPDIHLAVEKNLPVDWSTYSPKYFLLNGRSSPDTLSPNDAPWLPGQPYGAMVRVKPLGASGDMLPALVRYVNVSPTDVAFHPHGNTERVIAEDASPLDRTTPSTWSAGATVALGARVLPSTSNGYVFQAIGASGPTGGTEPNWPTTAGLTVTDGGVTWLNAGPYTAFDAKDHTYGSFLVDIGAGRTADAEFSWAQEYDPSTNAIPASVPILGYQDLLIKGTWYSMNPYLGLSGELPPGVANHVQCGEYYHIAHNHSLNKATNYGATFGGQATLIRIDPPAGCPAA